MYIFLPTVWYIGCQLYRIYNFGANKIHAMTHIVKITRVLKRFWNRHFDGRDRSNWDTSFIRRH